MQTNQYRHQAGGSRWWAKCVAGAALALVVGSAAADVGTAFTYQGYLEEAGVPREAPVVVTFQLFDACPSGSPQSGVLTRTVDPERGLFTEFLDFGVAPFVPNEALYMQITVGGVLLDGCQELTPAPFSISTRGINVDGVGNVGIGTTSPATQLHVQGPAYGGGSARFESTSSGGFIEVQGVNVPGVVDIATVGLRRSDSSQMAWMGLTGPASGVVGDLRLGFLNDSAGEVLRLKSGTGNVGIGVTNPGDRLTVAGGVNVDAFAQNNGAHLPGLRFGSSSAETIASKRTAGGNQFGLDFYTGGTNRMAITNGGNVGIGTTTPQYRLDVVGRTFIRGAGGVGGGGGIWMSDPATPQTTRSYIGRQSEEFPVTGIFSNQISAWVLSALDNGLVGIGTTAPAARLHVKGNANTLALEGSDHAYVSFFPDGAGAGRKAYFGFAGGTDSNVTLRNEISGGHINLETLGGGRTRVQILEILGGADVAEPFDVVEPDDVKIEPGMVVVIDPRNPGKLMLSAGAYDRRVAGVISGAGGVQPGMVLRQEASVAEGKYPVALTGRVYVWCDATSGAIEPGDLLTTSDTPGHAMKVADHAAATGAVIGKAMSSLTERQTGLVLVLVNLQ